MSSPVLELNGIYRSYAQGERQLDILRDASLIVQSGELVALIGPSGSGKSTLLHIAGLLDTPQAGEVMIDGIEAHLASDTMRDRLRNLSIGFIYQFHHLLGECTALENVMIPQRIAGVANRNAKIRAEQLLERLGLSERAHHLPSQLSGGEQQRVAIARALANHPRLLLADEPTGNLDPATSDRVRDLLIEVAREEGVAAIIATHNMALAEQMNRVMTLKEGALVQTRGRPV